MRDRERLSSKKAIKSTNIPVCYPMLGPLYVKMDANCKKREIERERRRETERKPEREKKRA